MERQDMAIEELIVKAISDAGISALTVWLVFKWLVSRIDRQAELLQRIDKKMDACNHLNNRASFEQQNS